MVSYCGWKEIREPVKTHRKIHFNQPTVFFSHTKLAPAMSYQPTAFFSHNKSELATSHSLPNTVDEDDGDT